MPAGEKPLVSCYGAQSLFFQKFDLTLHLYSFLLSKDSTLFAELGYFADTDDLHLDAAHEAYVSTRGETQ